MSLCFARNRQNYIRLFCLRRALHKMRHTASFYIIQHEIIHESDFSTTSILILVLIEQNKLKSRRSRIGTNLHTHPPMMFFGTDGSAVLQRRFAQNVHHHHLGLSGVLPFDLGATAFCETQHFGSAQEPSTRVDNHNFTFMVVKHCSL